MLDIVNRFLLKLRIHLYKIILSTFLHQQIVNRYFIAFIKFVIKQKYFKKLLTFLYNVCMKFKWNHIHIILSSKNCYRAPIIGNNLSRPFHLRV